jgi:hypothetical protein
MQPLVLIHPTAGTGGGKPAAAKQRIYVHYGVVRFTTPAATRACGPGTCDELKTTKQHYRVVRSIASVWLADQREELPT